MSERSEGVSEQPEPTLIERVIAALIEYDDALCLHAGMISRKEQFTRADGWGLVEMLREKYDGPALIEELRALAGSAHV